MNRIFEIYHISLLITLFTYVMSCPSITCSGESPNPTATYPTCLTGTLPNLSVYTCPATDPLVLPYKCGWIESYTSGERNCWNISTSKWPPGSKANYPEDCSTQELEDGYCRGMLIGNECSYNRQCDVGLFCNQSSEKCEKNAGGTTCTKAQQCPPTYGCHKGICTKFGTLPIGTTLDQVSGYWDVWLCASYWADPFYLNCSEGFTISGNQQINQTTDVCGIQYLGQNVGTVWADGTNPFLQYLAKGTCCYRTDQMATCPLSPQDQGSYIQQVYIYYIYIYIYYIYIYI